MFNEWISSFLLVMKFWKTASYEAFLKAWSFVGGTKEGIAFSCLVVVVFALVLLIKCGWRGMQEKIWEKAIEGLVVISLAFSLVFLWKLFAEPSDELSFAQRQLRNSEELARAPYIMKFALEADRDQWKQRALMAQRAPEPHQKDDIGQTIGKLFPDQRGHISVENVHFMQHAISIPSEDKAEKVEIPFPLQGVPMQVQVKYKNRGDLDAADISWFGRVFISVELDPQTEEQMYGDMLRGKPYIPQPFLRSKEEGVITLASALVSPDDSLLVKQRQKYVYVFVASKLRDRLGANESHYCSRYATPNWGEDIGCHGHNN
jgi:hypothetical protein